MGHFQVANSLQETLDARVEYTNDEVDGRTQHKVNQYTIVEEIGRGSYGAVHIATDQFGNEFVSHAPLPYVHLHSPADILLRLSRSFQSLGYENELNRRFFAKAHEAQNVSLTESRQMACHSTHRLAGSVLARRRIHCT